MDKIRLPKEIKKILTLISGEKCAAYVAGAGVRELAAGADILRWTVLTDADLSLLVRLFPRGKLGKNGIFFLERCGTELEGKEVPVFFAVLEGTLDECLGAHLVTADAFACDGRDVIDPWGGLADACAEQIRLVRKDADKFLEEKPDVSLALIEYAASSGFCLMDELKPLIRQSVERLKGLDKKTLTDWFERVITSPFAGQGLRYIRDCGLLPVVVGERICRTMDKNEKKALDMYIQNIDGTLSVLERRLTTFYLGFLKKRDFAAMGHLGYDDAIVERELYAHKHLSDLHFVKKKKQLKRLLYEQGIENYQFLESIVKIQSKIYNLDTSGIFARHSLLLEISKNNEAVFIEDLAVTEKDLIEAGATKDETRAQYILSLLPYYVHRWPKFNTKEILVDQAKKIGKNKWKELRLKHVFLRG